MITFMSQRALIVLTILALLLMAALSMGAGLPEPKPIDELEKELITMAKVIEESLDRSGLGDWHRAGGGASAFDPRVSARYIPAVGAIFSISVSFPVIEPPAAPPDDQPRPEPADLWEKHSGDGPAPEPFIGEFNPERPEAWPDGMVESLQQIGPQIEEAIRLGMEEAHRGIEEAMRSANEAQADAARAMRDAFAFRGDRPRAVVYRGAGPAAPYEREKVERLRSVVLESLAKYGHRIEHMAADESIIVIAHAPRAGEGVRAPFPPGPPRLLHDVEPVIPVQPAPPAPPSPAAIPSAPAPPAAPAPVAPPAAPVPPAAVEPSEPFSPAPAPPAAPVAPAAPVSPEAPEAPKAARAPKAPKAPKAPRAPKAPKNDFSPFGRGDAPFPVFLEQGNAASDSYAISLRKSDLTEGVGAAALEGKIQEFIY